MDNDRLATSALFLGEHGARGPNDPAPRPSPPLHPWSVRFAQMFMGPLRQDLATQDAPLDRLCYAPCRPRYLTHVEADLGGHGWPRQTGHSPHRRHWHATEKSSHWNAGCYWQRGAEPWRARVKTSKKPAQQCPAEGPPGVKHSRYCDWKFLGHFCWSD